jgi:magnesium transporter
MGVIKINSEINQNHDPSFVPASDAGEDIADSALEENYKVSPEFVWKVEELIDDGSDGEDDFSESSRTKLKELFDELHPADAAELIAQLKRENRLFLVGLVKDDFDPEVITYLTGEPRIDVIKTIGAAKVAKSLVELEQDDIIEIINDLDELRQQEILQAMPIANRNEIAEQLSYPEQSAGRLMTRKIVAVPEYWKVGNTIDYLRAASDLPLDFYEIYIVDPKYRPVGGILLSRFMVKNRDVSVREVMSDDDTLRTIPTDMDQEEVAYIFRKYGLVSAPVINEDGRLVGVITVDDIVHVIQQEAHEDLMRLGGVTKSDFYLASFKAARKRFPWLSVNLLTAFTNSVFISMFAATIEQVIALAALMPVVASLAGNAGTQSLTVAVRSIAARELGSANFFRVLGKEFVVCLSNAVVFGSLSFLLIYFVLYKDLTLGLVFVAAITVNFLIAGLMGTTIPYVLHKFKADPAISSGVFLTAFTDIGGFLIFLSLATLILI